MNSASLGINNDSSTAIVVDGIDITQPHSVWVGKCTPPPKGKNAIFWRAFHIADDHRNCAAKLYAVCNLCGHVLMSHNSGTTNLRRHMKSQHENVYDKLMELNEKDEEAGADTPNKKRASMSPIGLAWQKRQKRLPRTSTSSGSPNERALLAQAMYCISANRPFAELETPAFQGLVLACLELGRSGATMIPNASAARTKAVEAIQRTKSFLKTKLQDVKDLVACLDVWTTRQQGSIIQLAVRWIDGFHLRHCVLAKLTNVPTEKEALVETLSKLLKEWDLEESVSFLVHNSAPEVSFPACLKENALVCFDHLLQKIVDDTLAEVGGTVPLSKAQNFVDQFVASRPLQTKLSEMAVSASSAETPEDGNPNKGSLVADVMGRWWSIVAMIDSLVVNKELLQKLFDERPVATKEENDEGKEVYHFSAVDGLTSGDWEFLEQWQAILKPLAAVSKMLGENANATASLIPFIVYVVRSELQRAVAPGTTHKELAEILLKHFETTFGANVALAKPDGVGIPKVALLAHALDPRFKQLKVLSSDEDRQTLWDKLLEEMIALEGKTSKPGEPGATGDVEAASILSGVVQKEGAKQEPKESLFDQYAGVLEGSSPKQEDTEKWKEECKKELKLYEAESTVGMRTINGKEDPLSWWEKHQIAFPTLWLLAQKYLAIPATATSPSLAFNLENSSLACGRLQLSGELPSDCDFLMDNGWVMEEVLGDA
eukprot:Nitzschia sp. Nitz4//NODE_293_length_29386_cov_71.949235//20248//22395//NITZ4_additional_000038-RA//1//CDS//3329531836//7040//frame0